MKTRLSVLLLALVLATGCGPADRLPALPSHPPMRVARNYWPGQFWVDLAWADGSFAREGLRVEAVDTNADYYGSMDDLVTGRLDAQQMPLYDVLLRNLRGAELVAVIAGDYSYGDSIIARPDVKTLRDLKRRVVAAAPGTYQEYLLDQALRDSALSIADVKIKPVTLERSGRAFDDPDVAAVVTWGPFADEAIARGGHRVFSSGELRGGVPDVWAFRREFVASRPDDVRKFVAVWRRTTERIRTDPEAAYARIARLNRRSAAEVASLAASTRIMDLADNSVAFRYAAGLESLHGSARSMNRFLIERGLADSYLDTTLFVDDDFVRWLEAPRD